MPTKLQSLVSFIPVQATHRPSDPAHGRLEGTALLGDVADSRRQDQGAEYFVRWSFSDGSIEEKWLQSVRGLDLQRGDRVLIQRPANHPDYVVVAALGCETGGSPKIGAKVDGQRVLLEGKDEIVLRCGEASITLRRNGRVVIRGAYVESRSRGTNRIKGGSVQIN